VQKVLLSFPNETFSCASVIRARESLALRLRLGKRPTFEDGRVVMWNWINCYLSGRHDAASGVSQAKSI
jgi:hypothetical protein